jgi:predicted nucleic acid-binding Zn ribbon protein
LLFYLIQLFLFLLSVQKSQSLDSSIVHQGDDDVLAAKTAFASQELLIQRFELMQQQMLRQQQQQFEELIAEQQKQLELWKQQMDGKKKTVCAKHPFHLEISPVRYLQNDVYNASTDEDEPSAIAPSVSNEIIDSIDTSFLVSLFDKLAETATGKSTQLLR